MKFHTHERLITTLIGQHLYKNVDAAVRELLQNAEDACSARQLTESDSEYEPRILVRYSMAGGWFEVRDNGIGMSEEVVAKSFSAVGASKTELQSASHGRQIGYFGIGILSCFGIATRIRVETWSLGHAQISFEIPGPRDEFVPITGTLDSTGTRITVSINSSAGMTANHVPDAVRKYVRHASHIVVEDVDSGSQSRLDEQWNAVRRDSSTSVDDVAIARGFISLAPGWDTINQPLNCELIVCNGGFLVTPQENELLPAGVFGYVGEIDIRPGALAINMNRESFIHDSDWTGLGARLKAHFVGLVREKLDVWRRELPADASAEHVCRALAILAHDPTRQIINEETRALVDELLPSALTVKEFLTSRERSVSAWVADHPADKQLILIREGDENRQVQESVAVGGHSVSFTESVSTARIRANHLVLRGHRVLCVRQRTFRASFGSAPHKVSIDDAQIVQSAASKAGVPVRWLTDVADSEVGFSESDYERLIGSLLGFRGQMKFVSIPGADSVIRDFAGRLVNLASTDMQEILEFLPDAVGNPIRRELLCAYIDLRNYQSQSAERRIRALLRDPDLAEKLTFQTGAFTREYLNTLLKRSRQAANGDGQ